MRGNIWSSALGEQNKRNRWAPCGLSAAFRRSAAPQCSALQRLFLPLYKLCSDPFQANEFRHLFILFCMPSVHVGGLPFRDLLALELKGRRPLASQKIKTKTPNPTLCALETRDASYILIIIKLCYILTKKQFHLRQELIHLCRGELA